MPATTKVLVNGSRKLVVNVTKTWATGDEADDRIVDRSTYTGPDGVLPGRIRVDEITWAISPGIDTIRLEFDDGTDEVIENLQGQGYMDYRPFGGKSMSGAPATDTEGDIMATEVGGAANDSWSILLNCTLCKD